ncbi:hypothetical protein [Methylobacterium soli]|uniref:Helix-turn-helix domain-containing protein n=1 Tax=Methylobacterium soli TaxID=553447 RepID=A0A6L3SWW5_9HYPH|nr:hypothetical protein [Methylobacterium soli]KAB1072535.1 hypothetical protein F6X53_28020 [Methylobacterium soli]GJE43852.1 hypothetical protein AEGHOMDF_3031 [Methylobacterium soli]
MFADEIRRAVEAAPRVKLPDVAALLWRAFGAGQVTEAEAEALSNLIEARKIAPVPTGAPRKPVGSRPRTDASMERRRRWAASGRLPPQLAARFTLAEAAVLAVVASETVRRGDCRLCVDHIAAIAGVGRSTVKNAIRQARTLGLVTVEERAQTAWRNLSNVVRIVSKEWQAWNRLVRRPSLQRGGVKTVTSTNTQGLELWGQRAAEPEKTSCRRAAGGLNGKAQRESARVAEGDGAVR